MERRSAFPTTESLRYYSILLGFTVSICKGLLLKGETVIVFDMDSLSIVQPNLRD